MPSFTVGEAAELLGVSPDTVRRWTDSGQLSVVRTAGGRRRIDGKALARFSIQRAGTPVTAPVAESARNHFSGLVTKVVKDKVMAQVEIQAGPYRVVSLMSREAADELELAPGVLAVASVKSTNVVVEVPYAVNRPDPDPEGTLRMRSRFFRFAVPLVAALALLAAACGSDSKSSSASSASSSAAAAPMTGNLNVFAAASLTEAFNNAKKTLTAENPSLNLTYNFAGSNTLVSQIQQGAPADVFASADQKNVQTLVTAGLVDTPVTFATNKLQIAVAAGNPKGITGLADLARPDVTVVLEAQGVPAGDYTRQVLAAKGITVTPKSLETDVKSALAKVTSGEADATVVYVTDVTAAGPKVQGVVIPDADQPDISYPIAVVKATKNPSAAQAFVDSAVSGDVQKSLQAAGFSAPT